MKKFPIAERFTSLQGEGLYTGTVMHFIRFAGCSVGSKMTESEKLQWWQKQPAFHGKMSEELGLPVYTEKCCTYDGREFLCDTDFRTKEILTTEEILAGVPKGVKHICLTGGEPLIQPLGDLLDFVGKETEYSVHIETSGTISLEKVWPAYSQGDSLSVDGGWLWVTVSPKRGLLDEMIGVADEIKLLVDDQFDVSKIPEDILDHNLVWLQPVNAEFDVDRTNLEKCIALVKEHPNWRLSTQMHKIWMVR